eukprot:364558-Chlamydomonas_euryale.AAC.4
MNAVSDAVIFAVCAQTAKNIVKHRSSSKTVPSHLPVHLRDWPEASASAFAALASQCCAHERKDRPAASVVRDQLLKLYVEADLAELGAEPLSGKVYSFEGYSTTDTGARITGLETATAPTPGHITPTSSAGKSSVLASSVSASATSRPAASLSVPGATAHPGPATTVPKAPTGVWGAGSVAARLKQPPSPQLNTHHHTGPKQPGRLQQPIHAASRPLVSTLQQPKSSGAAAQAGQGSGSIQRQQISAVLHLDKGTVSGYVYFTLPGSKHDVPERACPVLNGSYDGISGTIGFSIDSSSPSVALLGPVHAAGAQVRASAQAPVAKGTGCGGTHRFDGTLKLSSGLLTGTWSSELASSATSRGNGSFRMWLLMSRPASVRAEHVAP